MSEFTRQLRRSGVGDDDTRDHLWEMRKVVVVGVVGKVKVA
jgi:hypothetical protein